MHPPVADRLVRDIRFLFFFSKSKTRFFRFKVSCQKREKRIKRYPGFHSFPLWNIANEHFHCKSITHVMLYVCFGSSSVFQFLFGYLGRCSCSFTSIDTLSAWHYDFQVCSRWWSRSNEYFDEFDCLRCLAAELDFNPAGFTVVACTSGYAWPVYNTRRNTRSCDLLCSTSSWLSRWPAPAKLNWTSNLEATLRFLTLLLTGGTP